MTLARKDVTMRRNRLITAAVTGFAVAASVTSVTAAGTTASASTRSDHPTGLFATWRAAQAAARFPLRKPTKTDGLVRNSKITVTRCEISKKKAAKRVVIASYGLTPRANLTLNQNNSNGPCARLSQGKFLGRFRVDGTVSVLIGDCGRRGLPPCASKNIFLFLIWRNRGTYYQAPLSENAAPSSWASPAASSGFKRTRELWWMRVSTLVSGEDCVIHLTWIGRAARQSSAATHPAMIQCH